MAMARKAIHARRFRVGYQLGQWHRVGSSQNLFERVLAALLTEQSAQAHQLQYCCRPRSNGIGWLCRCRAPSPRLISSGVHTRGFLKRGLCSDRRTHFHWAYETKNSISVSYVSRNMKMSKNNQTARQFSEKRVW